MMRKMAGVFLSVLALVVIAAAVVFGSGVGTTDYYTQIDNARVEAIEPEAGMTHSYTLTCFSEDGESREITFRTERVLRAQAFLKLTVAPLRGVTGWEEVQRDELPAAVQLRYGE